MYDAIIVGGGIAGLSAALVLGRCRRRVLVCDSDRPRNGSSRALHGFLSRDGIDPWELRRLGREQLLPYTTIEFRLAEVDDVACREEGGFTVQIVGGDRLHCRKLLLATGIVDLLPSVEGIENYYGRTVFHCPYCDGWENRDNAIAVYGQGEEGVKFALEVGGWSADIVLCTDGGELSEGQEERLFRQGIKVRREKLLRLEGEEGQLRNLLFATGEPLPRQALFFLPEQAQHSELARRLGCPPGEDGLIATGKLQGTNVPGFYIAGDAARSVKLAIIAAAEGAEAAFAINTELQKEISGKK